MLSEATLAQLPPYMIKAHVPLDRASRMEDVLYLFLFITLEITQGPYQHQ